VTAFPNWTRWAPLRSFGIRDFRLLWVSDALGSWAEQTEFIVLSWFVLVTTDSPLLVGVFGALRLVGTLFSPLHGVIADRYNRALLFAAIRTVMTIITAVVLTLAISGQLKISYVLVLMSLAGIMRSGYIVTRQALIADKLSGEVLMNGVALNRVAWYGAQLSGPLAGGILLSKLGTIWAYLPVVVLNAAASIVAYTIRPAIPITSGPATSIWRNLTDAFHYIKNNQVVMALLLMAFLVNLAAFPLTNGIMTVFARDVLGTGPTGLATLLATYAASALVASFALATLNDVKRPGRFLLVTALAWHLGLLLLATSRSFGASLVILFVSGIAQSFSMVTMSMLLLKVVSPEMRGRVMGARALAIYSLPLGLLISGALANFFGAHIALAASSLVGASFTIVIAVRLRELWRLD